MMHRWMCRLRNYKKSDLRETHLHLRRCSENTLFAMLRAARLSVPKELIEALYTECNFQARTHRIAPRNLSRRMAKYNGEILPVDICYPFPESHPEAKWGGFPSLISAGSLPRYVNCSPIGEFPGENALIAFLNDLVSTIGIPRRIIMDNGGPGFRSKAGEEAMGRFWMENSHGPSNHSIAKRDRWTRCTAAKD